MAKKPLPTVKTLEFKLNLPLTGKDIYYRPYNVAEEKILLAAATTRDSDPEFYIRNTLNVIRGTVLTDINLEDLPSQEVKLLMLNLRGKAVDENIEFVLEEDGEKKKFVVNTENFYITVPEKDFYKIPLKDGIGLKMKNLTFKDEISYGFKFKESPTDAVFQTLFDSVESIYNEQDVWVVGDDITKEEAIEFVGKLTGVSEKLYEFLKNMPTIAVKTIDPITQEERILTNKDVDFLS